MIESYKDPDQITSPDKFEEDVLAEQSLRPSSFDDFIGQKETVENLKVYIKAAVKRDEALDHVLLFGPPGLGKTTLAGIIAKELKVNIKNSSGPVMERPGDLAGILTNFSKQDVFFIDEIHRLSSLVEEYLYSAMEDYRIDILIDSGPNARTVRIDLEPFTLVGATTRLGKITTPMRDRFGAIFRLEYYKTNEIFQVLERTTKILNVTIDKDALHEIALRSRGTPRVANRILRRVRDFAQVQKSKRITINQARESLDSIGIDKNGLEEMDRKILKNLISKFNGGPTGGKSLAISVNEDLQTIEDVYEPYLIKEGFIERTSRGRKATERAYKLFNIKKQESLFND